MVTGLFHVVKADQPAPSFSFTAAGDYGGIYTSGGQDSTGKKVANAIFAKSPDFHIVLGDLGYDSQNPTDWCNSFKGIYPGSGGNGSLVLIAGNHDTKNGGTSTFTNPVTGTSTANPTDALTNEDGPGFLDPASTGGNGYVNACGAPPSPSINWIASGVSNGGSTCQASLNLSAPSCYGREYYFDYPTSNPIMRFVMISAGINGSWAGPTGYTVHTCPDSPLSHYCWLNATITEGKNRGLWITVALHKECLSDGTSGMGCESTLDPFNLALSLKADLWLDGHDHNYQRSEQLSGPCSVSGGGLTCGTRDTGKGDILNPYSRGGTVVNIVGTGGKPQSNICPSNSTITCPNWTYFKKLCGLNGDISVSGVPQTSGCGGDYGFLDFHVNTTWLNASFVSASGTFMDNYYIKVSNPSVDFSISPNPALLNVSQTSNGGSGTVTINVDSFGFFSGLVSLSATISGPAGTCPGTKCPVLTGPSPASVQVNTARYSTASLTVSTNGSTTCGTFYAPTGYTITVTATSGSLSHHAIFSLHVYLGGDVNGDHNVNIADLVSVAGIFGLKSTDPGFNSHADLNSDQLISIKDLVLVASDFGASCSS